MAARTPHVAEVHPSDAGLEPAIAAIVALLRQDYGLSAAIQRIAGENENYEIVDDSGARFVLKVADNDQCLDLIGLEHAAVEAMYGASPGLALPRIVMTRRGTIAATLPSIEDGPPRLARLLTYVDGGSWFSGALPTPEIYRDCGRQIGALATTLATLQSQAARRTHRWDLARAGQHRARVHAISDLARRQLAARALALWSASAEPFLSELPHSVIHGDLNDENLRIKHGQLHGLLDFGDCLLNPTICDLAIALAYLVLDAPKPFESGAELVAGYHEVRPLSGAELEVLFPLICGRLATSVVISAERRQVDASRAAWFVTEERAWRTLERYMKFAPADAARRLASGTDVTVFGDGGNSSKSLRARRQEHFSGALKLSFDDPARFVRARAQYLFDEAGAPHLDLYNNVCHVGHCHPRVVEAAHRQMARINTNTRYLFDELYEYAERLCQKLPPSLQRCFFVNSGSEANELALRLARTHTGGDDVVVLDNAYHGHTSTLIDVSPYKFMGRGGAGRPAPWVHVAPMPDGYRGPFKGSGPDAGIAYGNELGRVVRALEAPLAAMFAETLPCCGGQIIPPAGYFETAFGHVRQAGGVCILDEIQVGLGRVGSHFWAFEQQGATPDILVLGKPLGNGHPMAAVITTREIAESFAATGMEFFSTFGGNSVSCAVGLAVLDVIRDEGLQARAFEVGRHFHDGLASLMDQHKIIGDVRGAGLFLGIELVADRETLQPAPTQAKTLVNALRQRRVLTGTDGPWENVIKIKPPLTLSKDDVDDAVDAIDEILREMPL